MSYDRYGKYYGTDPRVFDSFYQNPLLGIDESGTGAIAGPISVAAVVLPRSHEFLEALTQSHLRDSKDIAGPSLERLFNLLQSHEETQVYTALAGPREIEDAGTTRVLGRLYNDVCTAFRMFNTGGCILLDGEGNEHLEYSYTPVVKGDQKSFTISAASVIAKVILDRHMREEDDKYPMYGFSDNKGYKTRKHAESLKKYGACKIHRRNTKPVSDVLEAALFSSGRLRR